MVFAILVKVHLMTRLLSTLNLVKKSDEKDSIITLITAYNSQLFGAVTFGDHSDLHVSISEKDQVKAYLFDPGGSYLEGRRGSGAFFSETVL